ncbi:MAG: serine/threonine-protein kinase [Planctomycetota bacterium]
MTSIPELPADLYDHVVRAVIAFERDGEAALVREVAAAGPHADQVRQHVESLRVAGLLQEPQQPDLIGPYRVLQRLGSGGMGMVFLCEQGEPVRRRVAVKVLRAGMDSAEILARFAVERRSLAALDHPGIAALLDAGTSAEGRPFLVLEYVPGLHLTRYCDDRQLDGSARLELFVRVCEAVQHAHHKGIVHRDLKPSNVLVVDRDGAPWPIVIDFGVARSVGGNAAGRTLLTLPGAMLGTPEYMSPEQASHELDVDTRADVFSLGVILYELLTGTLPIERERLRGPDVARVLGTAEPPTPSARITTLGGAADAIANHRRTDVAGLKRLVRGDLDWVVMKAIEKDRNRRYGMPAELAADVQRFLSHEPVSAGPQSRWYRLRKLCERNRPHVVAAALAMGAVAVALGTSTWFWRDAVASSRESSASLDDAMAAVGELVAVSDSDLVDVPHLTAVRRGLLERSIAFYRRFVGRADAHDGRLRPRIVEATLRLGCLQAQLGQHAAAAAALREATAQAEAMPSGSIPMPLLARGLDALADAEEHTGDAAAAVAVTRRAEELLRRASAAAADPETLASFARTLIRRSRQDAGRDKEHAHALATEAHALAAAGGADAAAWLLGIETGSALAQRLLDLGRRGEALPVLEAAFALWQRAARERVDSGLDWRLTVAVGEVAAQFVRCDDYGRMIEVFAAVTTVYERLVRDHPAVLDYRVGLARTRQDHCFALLRNYRFDAGIAMAVAAEADFAMARELAPEDPAVLRDSAIAAIALANAYREKARQGMPVDLDLARAARQRAAGLLDQLAQLPGGAASASRQRLEERRLFALLHPTPGAPEVVAAMAEAVTLAGDLIASTPSDFKLRERSIELQIRYGQALRQGGDAARAREVLAPALVGLRSLRGATESFETWVLRMAALLEESAQVDAALADVAALLGHLRERVETADNEDWGGKLSVVRLLLGFARGQLAAAAPQLLSYAREVVALANAAGDTFVQRGAPDASPAMVAMMRASTWALLVDVEQLAGDARAEAAALGEVAACRATANRLAPGKRATEQSRQACDAWLQRLLDVGDPALLATAGARVAEHAAGDAEGLIAAAKHLGAFVAREPAATAVRAAGTALLHGAVSAGAEPSQFATDAALQLLWDGRLP